MCYASAQFGVLRDKSPFADAGSDLCYPRTLLHPTQVDARLSNYSLAPFTAAPRRRTYLSSLRIPVCVMYLPETTTLLATSPSPLDASLGALSISNYPVNAICSFPLSGQYGPGARMLYYVLVTICIFAGRVTWMRGASLAAALLFPAVAAIHALIISSVSHSKGEPWELALQNSWLKLFICT